MFLDSRSNLDISPRLFDTNVKPILCYGAEIWGYGYSNEIEEIQTKFCKRYIGLKSNTIYSFVLGECSRYCMPVTYMYMTKCIKYWTKLLQTQTSRNTYQCYKMLRSLDKAGHVPWAPHIPTLLFEHGFDYVWIANTVGDLYIFATHQRYIHPELEK